MEEQMTLEERIEALESELENSDFPEGSIPHNRISREIELLTYELETGEVLPKEWR